MANKQSSIKPIMEQCLALSNRERKVLIRKLKESITLHERMTGLLTRANRIIDVVEGVCNVKFDYFSREHRYFMARCLVAYQLLYDGYTTTQAGMALRKDHTTILHMRGYINDLIVNPRYAEQDYELYREFKKQMGYEV